MVSRKIIENALTKAFMNKCSGSDKARKRGENGIVTYCTNSKYKNFATVEYPDGTKIVFHDKEDDYNGDLESITINGKTYNYLKDKAYTTFEKQEMLLDKNTEESDFLSTDNPLTRIQFMRFADNFATGQGFSVNEALRKNVSIEDLIVINNSIKSNYKRFVEFERTNTIDDTDYVSLRIITRLHDNDSINKRIVMDKAHTCTSVSAKKNFLKLLFSHDGGDDGDCWQILTVVDKNSGVTGAFLGNALKKARGHDGEGEINFAPKQKMERLLIDEEHKIIIQTPVT